MQKQLDYQGKSNGLRLGFDAKRAFFNKTGLGNYSRNLLSALTKYYPQNKFILYTPQYPAPISPEFLSDNKNIEIKTPVKYFHRKFSDVWRSFYMGEHIKKDQLDIFHGLSHELPVDLKDKKIKKVVTIHDLIFLIYPEFYPALDRRIYMWKFKQSCRTADKIIAISEQIKKDIMKYYHIPEEKIEVVYQHCNPIFEQEVSKETFDDVNKRYELPQNYFLYVGAIARRKNILILLKAFQAIKQYQDMDLVIVGDGGKYKKYIQRYIEKHHLTKRVKIYTKVPNEDLPAFYRQALVFVYPSIYEGFGIPLIESLYSRTPVITNRYGCFSEAAGPGAIYVDPESIGDLAQAMENFLINPNLRKKLSEAGYQYVQQFNEKAFADGVMKVYQQLLKP